MDALCKLTSVSGLAGHQTARAVIAASLLRAIDLLDAEPRDPQERVTAHLAAIPGAWGADSDGVTGPGKKGHGSTYVKRIAVLAAYAAANTGTFLGERFRRLASVPAGRAEEGRLRREPSLTTGPSRRLPGQRSR